MWSVVGGLTTVIWSVVGFFHSHWSVVGGFSDRWSVIFRKVVGGRWAVVLYYAEQQMPAGILAGLHVVGRDFSDECQCSGCQVIHLQRLQN